MRRRSRAGAGRRSAAVLCAAVLILSTAEGRSPSYVHESTVQLGTETAAAVAFDPGANRIWVGTRRGLLSIDLDRPRTATPFGRTPVAGALAFAPELNRLFVQLDGDRLAYVDVRASSEPVSVGHVPRSAEMVYEPLRRELYVFTRTASVAVFDARSGERAATIELPGGPARTPVAIPGRVFFTVARRDGLFSLDSTTRRIDRFPVAHDGTPVAIAVDTDLGQLFLAYGREVVAADARSGTLIGRAPTAPIRAMVYDPAARLLVATSDGPHGPRLDLYRLEPGGLVHSDRVAWVGPGLHRLEATRNGFVQWGSAPWLSDEPETYKTSLLLWKARSH